MRDLATGQPLREITGHRDILYDAELPPDGNSSRPAATTGRSSSGTSRRAKSSGPSRDITGAVYDIAFHPNGQVLASASADDTCKLWHIGSGERLDTLGQPLKEQYAIAFTRDGKHVVAAGADNRIRVWRLISVDKPAINPLVHARFAREGRSPDSAATPDGKQLVTVAEDRTVKLWETEALHRAQTLPAATGSRRGAGDRRNRRPVCHRADGRVRRRCFRSTR